MCLWSENRQWSAEAAEARREVQTSNAKLAKLTERVVQLLEERQASEEAIAKRMAKLDELERTLATTPGNRELSGNLASIVRSTQEAFNAVAAQIQEIREELKNKANIEK
jgi:uncharacterized coiled-coil DUF342 family protein